MALWPSGVGPGGVGSSSTRPVAPSTSRNLRRSKTLRLAASSGCCRISSGVTRRWIRRLLVVVRGIRRVSSAVTRGCSLVAPGQRSHRRPHHHPRRRSCRMATPSPSALSGTSSHVARLGRLDLAWGDWSSWIVMDQAKSQGGVCSVSVACWLAQIRRPARAGSLAGFFSALRSQGIGQRTFARFLVDMGQAGRI